MMLFAIVSDHNNCEYQSCWCYAEYINVVVSVKELGTIQTACHKLDIVEGAVSQKK